MSYKHIRLVATLSEDKAKVSVLVEFMSHTDSKFSAQKGHMEFSPTYEGNTFIYDQVGLLSVSTNLGEFGPISDMGVIVRFYLRKGFSFRVSLTSYELLKRAVEAYNEFHKE